MRNPPPLTDKQRLLLAADIIRSKGWGSGLWGWLRTKNGSLCILEALALVASLSRHAWSEVNPPEALIRECWRITGAPRFPSMRSVYIWNDSYCKSGDEAIELLEKVAASL